MIHRIPVNPPNNGFHKKAPQVAMTVMLTPIKHSILTSLFRKKFMLFSLFYLIFIIIQDWTVRILLFLFIHTISKPSNCLNNLRILWIIFYFFTQSLDIHCQCIIIYKFSCNIPNHF